MLPFRKMNGLGNDFVIFDARDTCVSLQKQHIMAIANRITGPGCDQFIIMEKHEGSASVFMRIFNPDGNEAEACGNAARCVAHLIFCETHNPKGKLRTVAGFLSYSVDVANDLVSVDMGRPRLLWDEIPLAEEFHNTARIELMVGPFDAPVLHSPAACNMGNPHLTFFVDDLDIIDLSISGPFLENHILLPEGANISLARVVSRDRIHLKVWERGAGLTKACGSAACAALVSAVRRHKSDRKATVCLPGGDLTIEWREDPDTVIMTGPITYEYQGEVDPATGDWVSIQV